MTFNASRRTIISTKTYTLSEYPDQELLQELWQVEGMRAKAIIQYLKANNLPLVTETSLSKHGQRYWNDGEPYNSRNNNLNDIEDFINHLESKGIGSVERVTVNVKKEGSGQFDEDGNEILQEKTTQTVYVNRGKGQLVELERAKIPQPSIKINSKGSKSRSKPSNRKLAISLPDMQIGALERKTGALEPTQDEQALDVAFQIMALAEKAHGIDLVVNQGDNLDFPHFSQHRSPFGYNTHRSLQYTIDRAGTIAATQRAIAKDADIVWLSGNHECLDDTTLAMTKNGPKHYSELRVGDLVLSAADDMTEVWLPIEDIHVYDYDGEMYHVDSDRSRVNMCVTPNHRVVGLKVNHWEKKRAIEWKETLASEYTNTSIPTALLSLNKTDANISDDEIKLIAWCLTDSHRSKNGIWSFYQSESKVERILGVLNRLELTPHCNILRRERDIDTICGKVLAAKPQASYDITLRRAGSDKINQIISSKRELPKILYKLSKRQMEVFLDEMVYTDGTIPTGSKGEGSSKVIYHSTDLRFDLQALVMLNGYSCTITEYRTGHFRLNITNKAATRLEKSLVKPINYKGKVWCVTVANGRFFAYRDGHPFLTGNSRLNKTLIDSAPQLVGLSRSGEEAPYLSIPALLRLDEHDIVYIDNYPDGEYWASKNLMFLHGSRVSSVPGTTAKNHLRDGVSVVHGHSHRQELLYRTTSIEGKTVTSFAGTAGHLARQDGFLPSSSTGSNERGELAATRPEKWQQGIWLIWYDPEGNEPAEVEAIHINQGKAIFRGQLIETTVDKYGEKLAKG